MKKSLLLLASLLMSLGTFAQWKAPTPSKTQEMATDGTAQFLYNVEAGGFFAGGNDWGTRASVTSVADSVKFVSVDGDLYNFACFPASKGSWLYVSCNNFDAMWVDAPNAVANDSYPGTDTWMLEKQANGSYKIYNKDFQGTFGRAEIYRGLKGDTRVYMNDPENVYEVNEEMVPSVTGKFYDEWYFIDSVEYKALQPKVELYVKALALEGKISEVQTADPDYNLSALNAVYNNTSSTMEELEAAIALADEIMVLKNALDNAVATYPNLDFSAQKAVYDNVASTKDAIVAAQGQVKEIINNYLSEQASFETPIDFSTVIGDGSSADPWTRDFTGEGEVGSHSTNTWSTEANGGADGTDMTTPFVEHWTGSGGILSDQKIYQVFKSAAPGLYKFNVNARAYSEAGGIDHFEGLSMYFGEESIDLQEETPMFLSGSKCVLWKKGGFTIFAIVKEAKDIELGFNIKGANFNWLAFKETSLKYYGNDNVEENLAKLIKQDYAFEAYEEENANPELIQAYNDAVEKLDNAISIEDIKAAALEASEAKSELDKNVAAYEKYLAKVEEIRESVAVGDLVSIKGEILADYTMEGNEVAPGEDEDFPCGSADYILINHELTTAQVEEEITRISELYKEALAESLYEGKDCTNLLSDADFSNANGEGWTVGKLGAPGAWTGGLIPGFPVCEAWHKTFDIYQEITVPNGIYAVSLNGFVRRDSGADVEAEVYMNDFATKFKDIQEGGIPMDDNAIDGFNCYLSNGTSSAALTQNPIFEGSHRQSPNDATDTTTDNLYAPNGMEGASVAFSAGRYEAVAYGLVQDGKIRLGVRNTRNDDWCLWGNFKLTYMGKNFEALQAILPSFVEQLSTFEEENADYLTTPTVTAIDAAIVKGNEAGDADEMYEALGEVNSTLVAAQANKAAVEAFKAEEEALNAVCEEYPDADQSPAEALADAIAGYADLTTAELEALTAKMKDAEKSIIFGSASEDNPADITNLFIENPDFNGGNINGWTDTFTAGNHGFQNNSTYGTEESIIDQFVEAWRASTAATPTPLDNGSISQEITLPAGSYVLSADVVAKNQADAEDPSVTGMYLFAGENRTPVSADSESPARFEVPFVMAEAGTIAIGLVVEETNGNWLAADNFKLVCKGADITAIKTITSSSSANGIYTVSGARVSTLQKGINIVNTNGVVRKVLVK